MDTTKLELGLSWRRVLHDWSSIVGTAALVLIWDLVLHETKWWENSDEWSRWLTVGALAFLTSGLLVFIKDLVRYLARAKNPTDHT